MTATRLRLSLMSIGCIAGLLLAACSFQSSATNLAASYFIILLAAGIGFSLPSKRYLLLIIASCIVALIFAATHLSNKDASLFFPLAGLNLFAAFGCVCWLRIIFLTQSQQSFYKKIFFRAWECGLFIFFSLIFAILCEVLLTALSGLFDQFGFSFISNIVNDQYFIFGSGGLFFGLATAVCEQNESLLKAVCLLLHWLARFLLPIMAVFSLLLCLAMLFGHQNHSLDTDFYQILLIGSLTLVNLVVQDGQTPVISRWLQITVNCFLVLMLIIACVALYPLITASIQHGLKPDNWHDMVFTSLLVLYCLGYVIAWLISRRQWLQYLMPANIILFVVSVIVSLLFTAQ